jgi:hypothetical protein
MNALLNAWPQVDVTQFSFHKPCHLQAHQTAIVTIKTLHVLHIVCLLCNTFAHRRHLSMIVVLNRFLAQNKMRYPNVIATTQQIVVFCPIYLTCCHAHYSIWYLVFSPSLTVCWTDKLTDVRRSDVTT